MGQRVRRKPGTSLRVYPEDIGPDVSLLLFTSGRTNGALKGRFASGAIPGGIFSCGRNPQMLPARRCFRVNWECLYPVHSYGGASSPAIFRAPMAREMPAIAGGHLSACASLPPATNSSYRTAPDAIARRFSPGRYGPAVLPSPATTCRCHPSIPWQLLGSHGG